jgi:hypothetical protein
MGAPSWPSASASADQLATPAADTVASGRRRGNGEGGLGISGTGNAAGSGAGDAGVSGAGMLESGGAEGAAITAPMNMANSSVTKTSKRSRPVFIRAAWVIGRLRRPAVASLIAGNRQGGRSSGPRCDGGSAARAAFAWERSPRTRKAHQAKTGMGQERPGGEISR